ncbi:deoxynucleoside kinase [bacterium]|nr:deoxynucleoside kinase [bacterium]
MSAFVHLVLAGNIGAGKTTVSQLLSERLGWRSYAERVDDNPFLADFYRDMPRWAFALQVTFLVNRLEDHRLIAERGESAIQDRSLHEDALIFARNLRELGLLSAGEWESYGRLYRQALALLRVPDLVVYLRRGLPGLLANIRQRGRDYEANIDPDYLSRLNGFYEEWIAARPGGRVLVVEADALDFMDGSRDLERLAEQVRAACPQGELFGPPPAPATADPRFRLLLP